MAALATAARHNQKLTDFSDLRDIVIAHRAAVRQTPVPETRKPGFNQSLFLFL